MRNLQADLDAIKTFTDERMIYDITKEWLKRAIKAEAEVVRLRAGLERIKTTIEEYHPHDTLTLPRFSFAKELHDIALAELEVHDEG